MPPFGPVKRRQLIAYLRKLGFAGPFSGGKHQYMTRGEVTVRDMKASTQEARLLNEFLSELQVETDS